ncbi:unnamed protein product, partial [marine sediment metagenome]
VHNYIRWHHPDVQWDYHARGFWKEVVKRGLPTRRYRWCCAIIKEAGGKGRTVITGIRHAEGTGRKKRKCFEQSKDKSKTFVNPIITWSDGEVWEYIALNNIYVSASLIIAQHHL